MEDIGLRPRDLLATRLRLMRHDLGLREGLNHALSTEEAGGRCGIVAATWRLWESGTSQPRHAEPVLRHVAKSLGYDEEWLLKGGPLEVGDAA